MLKSTTTLVCVFMACYANAQSPFGFFGGGRPSSPFGGGPSSALYGGQALQNSPFSSGPPSLIANLGPPRGVSSRPGTSFSPSGFGKPPRQSSPSKLFSWLGNTMSKIPGLVPKIHYHNPSKSKPSSLQGGPQQHSSSPPRETVILPNIPNSIFEDISSPYGGSSVSFAPNAGSSKHPPVNFRSPSGPPPPGFGGRPRGPPPSFAHRPPFGSRPPPSFSSDRPPSFGPGGPSGPGPFSGSSSPFSSPSSSSSGSPFGGPPSSSLFSQNTRNNLEVFPSQQISYQSQTLNQNEPGYNDALRSLQSIYASSSNKRPSYTSTSHYEQQNSYSQPQTAASTNSGNNYGATFHSVEPVQVAPIYDVNQNFKPSSADLSSSSSQNVQQQQQASQNGNIHDISLTSLVNDYSAQADADTSGSEQMISALQGSSSSSASSDMVTSASSHVPIPGVQILGQTQSAGGNPMLEVITDANSPTFDGHPVDLNKLISMIEPGAEIDTMPSYGGAEVGSASEQQSMYAEAPSNYELPSDVLSSGLLSGNKKFSSGVRSQPQLINTKNDLKDSIYSLASESKPSVVKLDGTRLNDEELIKEHFDKEIILDDLQENNDSGLIILTMGPDNQTGDQNDFDLVKLSNNGTFSSVKDKDLITDEKLIAIIQQLRNSANTLENPSFVLTPPENNNTLENSTSAKHPNHNYNPKLHDKIPEENSDIKDMTAPKINPIFDSVRPSRIRFSKSSSVSTSISSNDDTSDDLETTTDKLPDDNNDQGDSIDSQSLEDEKDLIEPIGDLAFAASRNVKSVAIIVTPPPHYVKIRNKYKKDSIPLSALTSTTTSTTVSPPYVDISALTSNEDINFEETLSESLISNNSNRNNDDNGNHRLSKTLQTSGIPEEVEDRSIPTSSTSTPVPSPLSSLEKSRDEDESETNATITNDAFLKSILSGVYSQSNNNSSTNNASLIISDDNDGGKMGSKKPRRYPVYRGKVN